jgi:hypothetical protein
MARQLPGRGEPFTRLQPARADGITQSALELRMQRPRSGAVQPQQELRTQTGPLNGHEIGPYRGPLAIHTFVP